MWLRIVSKKRQGSVRFKILEIDGNPLDFIWSSESATWDYRRRLELLKHFQLFEGYVFNVEVRKRTAGRVRLKNVNWIKS